MSGKNIYGFRREYSRCSMLCFRLANRYCLPVARKREQICSVSRNAVNCNIFTTVNNNVGIWMGTLHRMGDHVADRNINADTVVDIDVQGI